MPTISERCETLIIGGGVVGLSLAWHLARRGARGVLLVERNQISSGTSWHAAGIVGPLRVSPDMTRLAAHAGALFPQLERETGLATGYRVTGGYWLARVPERLDELQRIAAVGRCMGLTPEMIAPEALRAALPCVATEGLCGVMAVAEDATVNPVDLCQAYARGARAHGAEIRENTPVAELLVEGGAARGARLAGGGEIRAGRVAICAGAWSRRLAASAGLGLPLQAVEHMYVVTEPRAEFAGFPVLRDLDRGIYVKGDAGRLVIGGFEPDAKCWDPQGPEGNRPFLELPEDWEQVAPFMEAALALVPALETTGIQHFMNGPESFTADTRPLIGAAPEVEGLFVAAGMNSVGIMSSAGVGRLLAEWMEEGAPEMNAWEVDVARADPAAAAPAHMATRMKEAVADQFALHWPYRQPQAGRDLRRSALHECWQAAGAVFGVTAGWERGLWYAETEAERALPYSVGAQPWWPLAAREAARLACSAALLDLSPFSKFRVSGPGAAARLEGLCATRLDIPPGRVVHALFLNPGGGIEIEATIARRGAEIFDITTAAATRWRDRGWLRRALAGLAVEDRTEAFCVIGVMGAGSRALLRALAEAFADRGYGWSADVVIAGVACTATRLSFVGELGWELAVANAAAPALFDALYAAGARPMGHYALEGCRLEKGFVHWGHDIGPRVTPLEAGLGHAVDWSKDFPGRAALERERERGRPARRLVLCALEGRPLALHDEPVWEEGHVVGFTTSGGLGPRTGQMLAFALVEETGRPLAERRFEIEIAGRRWPARPLPRPPFDPKGERMRA